MHRVLPALLEGRWGGEPFARRALRRFALAVWLAATAVASGAAIAQQPIRPIPSTAAAGLLEMKLFPEALIDGNPVRLGAGARIRDLDNRIVMPATLGGRQRVLYTKDGTGAVDRIWLATESEYDAAKKNRP